MPTTSERSEVRTSGRQARQAITGPERSKAEALLISHLKSLHALQAPTVGLFIAHDGEPDLQPLIEWLWDQGTTVALPVLADDPADSTMGFVPWTQGDALCQGRYEIPVPPAAPPIEPQTLVVSLTGFDPNGNRMGRGGGFFDRYLSTTGATAIGVGFEVQRFNVLPIEPHDQPLPVVVTDLGIRNCTQYLQEPGVIGKDCALCA